MRISFKYAILAPIVGVVVVGAIMAIAPIVVNAMSAASRAPVPTEPEVCAHLEKLGVTVPDCPAWLLGSKADFGEHYDNRLRCYAAAADVTTAKSCDDPAVYMTDRWDG